MHREQKAWEACESWTTMMVWELLEYAIDVLEEGSREVEVQL